LLNMILLILLIHFQIHYQLIVWTTNIIGVFVPMMHGARQHIPQRFTRLLCLLHANTCKAILIPTASASVGMLHMAYATSNNLGHHRQIAVTWIQRAVTFMLPVIVTAIANSAARILLGWWHISKAPGNWRTAISSRRHHLGKSRNHQGRRINSKGTLIYKGQSASGAVLLNFKAGIKRPQFPRALYAIFACWQAVNIAN